MEQNELPLLPEHRELPGSRCDRNSSSVLAVAGTTGLRSVAAPRLLPVNRLSQLRLQPSHSEGRRQGPGALLKSDKVTAMMAIQGQDISARASLPENWNSEQVPG